MKTAGVKYEKTIATLTTFALPNAFKGSVTQNTHTESVDDKCRRVYLSNRPVATPFP